VYCPAEQFSVLYAVGAAVVGAADGAAVDGTAVGSVLGMGVGALVGVLVGAAVEGGGLTLAETRYTSASATTVTRRRWVSDFIFPRGREDDGSRAFD
jgi:hypothetical protein